MMPAAPTPPTPSSTKRARTRDALLVSAQALLMDHTVATLGLLQITRHAGLVHASFYTHYPDIAALISDLGELLGATHAAAIAALGAAIEDPAARFAQITRQTLWMMVQQPGFGRLFFDVGLPTDRMSAELRLSLTLDIGAGAASGRFQVADVDLAASMAAGAIAGLALDLHRGGLPSAKIDAATAALLGHLGVDAAEAERLAHASMDVLPPLEMPMRWLSLPPVSSPPLGARP